MAITEAEMLLLSGQLTSDANEGMVAANTATIELAAAAMLAALYLELHP